MTDVNHLAGSLADDELVASRVLRYLVADSKVGLTFEVSAVISILETCSVLLLLATAPLAPAQVPPPRVTHLDPEMTISVHDYADVPSSLLNAAEEQAREIYHRAGLETVWLNCSPKLEKIEPESCHFSDSFHLTLKISARAVNAQVRDRLDVLGTAYPDDKGAGYFAYVFYDRVQELASRQRLGHALLAAVMAHEIGHLLLESNSHSLSGIMCAHWDYGQLRNISQGAMRFIPAQSRMMLDRLNDRQGRHSDPAVNAPKQKTSALASSLQDGLPSLGERPPQSICNVIQELKAQSRTP